LQTEISDHVTGDGSPTTWFYLLHLGGALGIFAVALLLIQSFDLDWRVSRFFFDTEHGNFALREDWFLQHVAHIAARNAVVLFGLATLVLAVASFRIRALVRYRRLLWFVFVAMLLSSSTVSALKATTGMHCPNDLRDFGGQLPYVGLLESLPAGVAPGKCWPGGHASAGFCLFGIYFAARALNRRCLAASLLAGVLVFGFALGAARVAQGAHFVSHNVWSALICWLVTLGLYEAVIRRHRFRKGD
jgi:membrane-associated PAP2 superfamily phosphatase